MTTFLLHFFSFTFCDFPNLPKHYLLELILLSIVHFLNFSCDTKHIFCILLCLEYSTFFPSLKADVLFFLKDSLSSAKQQSCTG